MNNKDVAKIELIKRKIRITRQYLAGLERALQEAHFEASLDKVINTLETKEKSNGKK